MSQLIKSSVLCIALLVLLGSCSLLFEPTAKLEVDDASVPLGDATSATDDAAPPRDKIVFLTSSFFQGNLGGLDGADVHCTTAANNAGFPGTYRAWLSNSTTSAASRVAPTGPGRYILPGAGIVVALSFADLLDGQLLAPIDRTEAGNVPSVFPDGCSPGSIWTNTSPLGQLVSSDPTASCNDWTSTLLDNQAVTGNLRRLDSRWSQECISLCGQFLALYCIGI